MGRWLGDVLALFERGMEKDSPASRQVKMRRFDSRGNRPADDLVACEEPLEIRLGSKENHRPIAITMRTPGHDIELAVGFLFTEGILKSREDIVEAQPCGTGGNTVRIEVSPLASVDWGRLQRHFYSTSSCGVCGKSSLDALEVKGLSPLDGANFVVEAHLIVELPARLRAHQEVFDQTGGLHAAALFDSAGTLHAVREDVGRHNAVDKLVGAEFLEGRAPLAQRILFLSGRASFELVQKALVAGIPFIAAVGAPSSLAVDLARRFDITLLGFVREGRFNVYHGERRVKTS